MDELRQRFLEFAPFVAHMDSKNLGTSEALSVSLGLPWLRGKDFGRPESFTDAEVKQIFDAMDKQKEEDEDDE